MSCVRADALSPRTSAQLERRCADAEQRLAAALKAQKQGAR
jgi:hypothetical protein